MGCHWSGLQGKGACRTWATMALLTQPSTATGDERSANRIRLAQIGTAIYRATKTHHRNVSRKLELLGVDFHRGHELDSGSNSRFAEVQTGQQRRATRSGTSQARLGNYGHVQTLHGLAAVEGLTIDRRLESIPRINTQLSGWHSICVACWSLKGMPLRLQTVPAGKVKVCSSTMDGLLDTRGWAAHSPWRMQVPQHASHRKGHPCGFA